MQKVASALLALVIACAGCSRKPEQLPPLLSAIVVGDEARVQELIRKGADVNVANGSGRTALMYAAGAHLNDSERYMLRDKRIDRPTENVTILRLLLDHGAKVNAIDQNRSNALQVAIYQGRASSVKLLIERGADVNAMGQTMNPLMLAAYHCFVDIEQMLLESGANPSIQDLNGRTAEAIASLNNCPDGAKLIQSHNAK